jgi:hypothetical protein
LAKVLKINDPDTSYVILLKADEALRLITALALALGGEPRPEVEFADRLRTLLKRVCR